MHISIIHIQVYKKSLHSYAHCHFLMNIIGTIWSCEDGSKDYLAHYRNQIDSYFLT